MCLVVLSSYRENIKLRVNVGLNLGYNFWEFILEINRNVKYMVYFYFFLNGFIFILYV